MELTLQQQVGQMLTSQGCLWTEFDVPLGRGRSRADVVGYTLLDGKASPQVVVEAQRALDLSRLKQATAAAEYLRAPHVLLTDGTDSAWYERAGEEWRRLPTAPSLTPPKQEEISAESLRASLWQCADLLRNDTPNPGSHVETMVCALAYWSHQQDRFGGLTQLQADPSAVLTSVLAAMSPDESHVTGLPRISKATLTQVVRLLLLSGAYRADPALLLEQLMALRQQAGRHEGEHWSNPAMTRAVADLVASLAPNGGQVLDPTCGTGGFLAAIGSRRPDLTLIGVDVNPDAGRLGEAVLMATGAKHTFYTANTIKDDLERLEEIGRVQSERHGFDVVVFDPPFGLKVRDQDTLRRFEVRSQTGDGLFLERAISLLRPGGYLVTLVLGKVLSQSTDREAREYLLRETYLEAVLEVPSAYRSPLTSVKTYLLVARKKGPGVEPSPEVLMAIADSEQDNLDEALQQFLASRVGKAGD